MKRCISSFVTADGRAVAAGELVEDSDPVIKGREQFFAGMEVSVADAEKPTPEVDETNAEADEPTVPPVVDARAELREAEEAAEQADDERAEQADRSDVEEATAAPGEKRNARRSTKG